MKYKVLFVSLIVAVVVVATLGRVLISRSEVGNKTVVIGATLPLSGDLAFMGEGYKNGMNLALSELGTTRFKYQVVFEDDKFSPILAASAYQKLVSIDRANAIFSFGSPAGNAISPLAEKSKIIHINGIASDSNVAKGDYNFVHWTPPYMEAKLLSQELQRRSLKKVAILATNQPGTMAVVVEIKKSLANAGVKIVAEEEYNPGAKDMRSQLAKVKKTNPDIYIIESTSPELEIVTRQMREMGIKAPVTTIECFEFTNEPALFEGAWYVNAADQTPEFVAKYTRVYGKVPTLGAANGYDAVKMFVLATEKTKYASTNEIRNQLLKIKNYPGAVGNLSVDKEGMFVSEAVVRQINGGKPVTIK